MGLHESEKVMWYNPEKPDAMRGCAVPKYTRDLNLMWGAEKTLFPVKIWELNGPDEWKRYTIHLDSICMGHPGGSVHATAEQRAKAFCLMLAMRD